MDALGADVLTFNPPGMMRRFRASDAIVHHCHRRCAVAQVFCPARGISLRSWDAFADAPTFAASQPRNLNGRGQRAPLSCHCPRRLRFRSHKAAAIGIDSRVGCVALGVGGPCTSSLLHGRPAWFISKTYGLGPKLSAGQDRQGDLVRLVNLATLSGGHCFHSLR